MIQELKPIKLNKYSGRNTFSDITNLGPTEFRSISNLDIYGGMNGDYLRCRRGSRFLVPEGEQISLPNQINNSCVFPVNGTEYAIYSTGFLGGTMYAQQLPGNPVVIPSNTLEITGNAQGNLSNLVLTGLTPDNTDDYTLYYTIETASGPEFRIFLFKDAARTQQVASGDTLAVGVVSITEDGGSGISGSVYTDDITVSDEDGTISYAALVVGDDAPDMCVYNNRVYVFSQSGNKILFYDAGQDRIVGRPMGLEAPIMVGYNSQFGDMVEGSTYTYGLETVHIFNDADLVASSPRRRFSDNTIPVIDGSDGGIGILIDPDIFADPNWTHVRLWRSKNQTPDFSDPLFPIDAQGTIDQLWEVALITRNELLATSLTPVDTGGDLPPGNAGVEAGFNGSFYQITDGNNDSVLLTVIGLDLIGLIPLPGCRTGCVNKGRIWASGIGDNYIAPNGPLIDPVIREDALYTTEQLSQYQEQWDAQAYLDAGRDGQKTASLQVFMEDVIVFREGKAKRIASGNPASLVQMLDDKVGVPSFRMTGFISGIGICALCSDGYFRYMGFDERWHQYIGKTEISQSIYDLTSEVFLNTNVDFLYMNGKLLLLLPGASGYIGALGVKEGRGWSIYQYGQPFQAGFNFANGSRAAIAQENTLLREIETTDTQDEVFNDFADINWFFEGFAFSGEGGLLEATEYSFWGKLTSVPTVTAKNSNETWRMSSSFIDPGLFAANTNQNEREYIFTPEPRDTTPFKWVPLRGQFISFLVSGIGPAMLSWQKLKARIRPTNGNLGVYADGGFIPQGPGWNHSSYLILNFEDPATTFYDASGKGQNYEWADVGSKTNRVDQKPGKGLLMGAGGYVSRDTDSVSPDIGSKGVAWKACFSLGVSGSLVASGRDGDLFYVLTVSGSAATMTVSDGTDAYTYTSTSTFTVGVVYVLSFWLKSDLTGQFYYDDVESGSFGGARTTVRTDAASGSPIPFGLAAAQFSNLVLGGTYAGQTLYGRLKQATQFWILYATENNRDNEISPVGYFSGPPTSGTTYAFTAQNGSGITGSVSVDDDSFPFDEQDLDVVDGYPPPVVGGKILIGGIVSYFEAQKTVWKLDQAKRFWGTVKAF